MTRVPARPTAHALSGGDVFAGAETFHDEDGRLHSLHHPAVVRRDDDGVIRVEEWWRHGLLHREDGPAIIHRNAAGDVVHEEWWKENTRQHGADTAPDELLRLQGVWRLTGDDIVNGGDVTALSLRQQLEQRDWESKVVEATWRPTGQPAKTYTGPLNLHAPDAGGIRVGSKVFLPNLAGEVTVKLLSQPRRRGLRPLTADSTRPQVAQ